MLDNKEHTQIKRPRIMIPIDTIYKLTSKMPEGTILFLFHKNNARLQTISGNVSDRLLSHLSRTIALDMQTPKHLLSCNPCKTYTASQFDTAQPTSSWTGVSFGWWKLLLPLGDIISSTSDPDSAVERSNSLPLEENSIKYKWQKN